MERASKDWDGVEEGITPRFLEVDPSEGNFADLLIIYMRHGDCTSNNNNQALKKGESQDHT